jgi:hypothetical protein
MIHTVKIDDSTRTGKKLLSDLNRARKGVEFDNPAISGIIPEGYVSVDVFFDNVEKKLIEQLESNGYIK